jgi:PEGA domain
MRTAPFSLVLVLGACVTVTAAAQSPPPPANAARAEADDRYARAKRLLGENDDTAALAELQRVYELLPSPFVLYSIGLVHATIGRPVEAVDIFDRLLAAPGSLPPEDLARAKATRAEQAARVALVAVKANVAGASIEIDNLDAAKTPLAAPLKVASGTHVVTAVAPGYVPVRKTVTVAGRTQAEVAFELVPMQGRLAHLTVTSHLPAAEVLVDGEAAGETPLASSLSLAPGKHRVEIRRKGYVTARRDLVLGDGAAGEIALDPEEDPVLAASDGTLALDVREADAVVTLDDKLRGSASSAGLHLPGGLHSLRVERAGFFPLERDVVVPAGGAVRVSLRLDPTPDTLAAYTQGVRRRRASGWAGIVSGAVLTAVSIPLLAYDAGQKSRAESQYRTATAAVQAHTAPCDFPAGATQAQCLAPSNAAAGSYNAALVRDGVGYALGGVGVVALATGIVLLATGDDPHRYEKKPSGERLATRRVIPAVWGGRGGGAVGVMGSF